MILTCPKCESRFVIAAQALAPEGRKVKCSSCSEIWHQLPDPDELIEEIETGLEESAADDPMEEEGEGAVATEDAAPIENEEDQEEDKTEAEFEDDAQDDAEDDAQEQDLEAPQAENVEIEDIPESVKPRPEDSQQPAVKSKASALSLKKTDVIKGAALFLLLISPLFVFKGALINAWPESIAFYRAIGLSKTIPGEGLIFDQIIAKQDGDTIVVTGQIINLTSKDTALPFVEIGLQNGAGDIISNFYIKLPQSQLKAEEVIPFTASYAMPDGAALSDLVVRFALKPSGEKALTPKSASTNGDNTHAQSADAHSVPHADAKASKSPERAAAPPHPAAPSPHQNDHH